MENKKEFKIGDLIITTGNSNFCRVPIGTIGKIELIHPRSSNIIKIEGYNINNNDGNWIHGDYKHYETPLFKILVHDENVENSIFRVENNEGNIFQIGDKVRSIIGNVEDPETMIILSFRYNKTKTNICAVTKRLYNTGIGINKLEHVIEFKEEFILPEKWCIKITNESRKDVLEWFQNNKQNSFNGKYENIVNNNEFMHYPLVSTSHRGFEINKFNNGYTEITFEQFKKYVLKESVIPENETNLEKAQRLYPIGTRFACLYTNQIFISTSDAYIYNNNFRTIIVRANNIGTNEQNVTKNIFSNNNWALISK